MNTKEKYRQLCQHTAEMTLFARDWWLDAVCGSDSWDVSLAKNGDRIIAALPYYKKRRWGFSVIAQPPLTQTSGPWLDYPKGQKLTTRLSWEKDVLTELIKNLPKFDSFRCNLDPRLTNWLPFYWQGFGQTTRYNYRLNDLSDLPSLYLQFASSVKNHIQHAQKNVTIRDDLGISEVFDLYQQPFKRQRNRVSYSFNTLKRLDDACAQHSCKKILTAVDNKGQVRGSLYVVWDRQNMHCILQGHHPDQQDRGISCLLRWEAIQFASKVSKIFNFTGSMIEGIERFMRAFGGEQQPYHQIYKINSRLLKIRSALRS